MNELVIGSPTRQLLFAALAFCRHFAFAFSRLSFALSAAFSFCSSAWTRWIFAFSARIFSFSRRFTTRLSCSAIHERHKSQYFTESGV